MGGEGNMKLTPRENYLRMLNHEIPEYVPSSYDNFRDMVSEELLTPVFAPGGKVITSFGVEYLGSPEFGYGATPNPNKIICPEITEWDKYIIKPDVSDRDWEAYYKAQEGRWDRTNHLLSIGGSDYWLTAVSFMGFENTVVAMYEEPDAFKEMLEYVSEFYLEVMKQEIYYCKPDLFGMMDDDAAYHAPFFSLDMYREFFKPLQQKHIDLAKENVMLVTRHDCGKCEQFVPDWIEMDVRAWNPAQVSNDLVGIKKKYGNAIALEGAWDSQGELGRADCDIQTLKDALAVYVDTFAPGGGFTYSAHLSGVDQKDPRVIERNKVIRDFYEDYVRNYYIDHGEY